MGLAQYFGMWEIMGQGSSVMKKLGLSLILLLIFCNSVFADVQSSINNGLNWLLTNQNADGSYGNQSDLIFRDTEEVLNTFNILNQKSGQYQSGIQWSTNTTVNSIDFIARKILLLSGEDIGTTTGVNILLSNQNTDGGWGIASKFESDSIDTSLALQALKDVNYSDQTVIQSAINYVLSIQNPDGGWGFYQGDYSSVYMTALVSMTLQQFPQTTSLATAINKAKSYLITHQNADGGFGSSSSTVYETAYVYMALVEVTTDNTVLGNAVNYLTANQSSDGSWNQDAYSTALALRALYLSENKPTPPPQPPAEITPPIISPSPTDTTITGKLTDASTGDPIAGAEMAVVGRTLSAKTGSTGTYTINGITQFGFSLKASATGYDSKSYNISTAAYGAYTIDFALSPSRASDIIITFLATDSMSYSANNNVTITATIENTGSMLQETIIIAEIRDNQGNTVALSRFSDLETVIAPLSSTTVNITWNTGQYSPDDYQVVFKVTEPSVTYYNLPGNVLAEKETPFTIQPFVGIANSAIKVNPTFAYVGATETMTLALSLTNQSNMPADLVAGYEFKSPSGAVLSSGVTTFSMPLEVVSTNVSLTTFTHTFNESGEYYINVAVYKDGVVLSSISSTFPVLSNIRIEPSRSVTPATVLPDGSGKVRITIELKGVEVK